MLYEIQTTYINLGYQIQIFDIFSFKSIFYVIYDLAIERYFPIYYKDLPTKATDQVCIL